MIHNAEDYETRAREAERLAKVTRDCVLKEDMLSLARIYRDYAGHLRIRPGTPAAGAWRRAANGC